MATSGSYALNTVLTTSPVSISSDAAQAVREEQTNSFQNFPDELVLHIFDFIPAAHLLTTAQVSRRWHRLSQATIQQALTPAASWFKLTSFWNHELNTFKGVKGFLIDLSFVPETKLNLYIRVLSKVATSYPKTRHALIDLFKAAIEEKRKTCETQEGPSELDGYLEDTIDQYEFFSISQRLAFLDGS